MGTVRIFIAPKKDEQGNEIPLKEQRLLMAEMDRFTATCKNPLETIKWSCLTSTYFQ